MVAIPVLAIHASHARPLGLGLLALGLVRLSPSGPGRRLHRSISRRSAACIRRTCDRPTQTATVARTYNVAHMSSTSLAHHAQALPAAHGTA